MANVDVPQSSPSIVSKKQMRPFGNHMHTFCRFYFVLIFNRRGMNNDKRIILAIALYAAVITMVLHTLESEGHDRFSSTKRSEQIDVKCERINPISSMSQICSETSCTDQTLFCLQPDANLSKDNDPVLFPNEEVNG